MPILLAGKTNKQSGFSYLWVLVAIVIVGILAEATHLTTWRILKADREKELLFRGLAYRRAIESYYNANGRFPRTLEDLIKDPGAANRHHLRALYPDPMVKGEKSAWRLIRYQGGGISGVASFSSEEPFKQANFPKDIEKFNGARSYADWIFEYVPKKLIQQQAPITQVPITPPVLKTY